MDKLNIINISKNTYYLSDDILELKLPLLDSCTNGRRMIDNLKIPKNKYIYAKIINNKWVSSNGRSYKFDKVFISTEWMKTYIADNNEVESEKSEEEEDSVEEQPKIKLMPLPGLIQLKKSEKMRDSDGNILEIEVRGTREHNNCFFRVRDIAKGFGMKNLHDNIVKENRGYINGIHYFYFLKYTDNVRKNKKIKNKEVKQLFLTYIGLLKVLFSSRNKTVSRFVDWATKTLFTAHLGSQEAKNKLSSKLLGVSVDIVREVFNKTSSSLPVLYLFSIGTVKDLRVTFNIGPEYDDNDIIYKGGETIDLTRRVDEHNSSYGKLPGTELSLKWYNYIDPQYTSQAETELLNALGKMGFRFKHKKYEELLIFGKKDMKIVIDQYDNISRKYTGHIKELVDKLKDAENKLLQKDSMIQLLQKDSMIQLLQKDSEIQLMKKDNEILLLKNQLLQSKCKK